ncbi:hypothetical protein SSPO_080220 [Streptomyces antimycoticus]|uniref:Uncharacterized protein n=1 Tax=Streptomyces antimycoticus TaxID=68175 RepID=A0A499UTQ1_9ACTN|nr:hypothetical protein SSPO_080220 [Streptomyces antimycoticus]
MAGSTRWGLDENGAPVVVENDRGVDSGVIDPGLLYLGWLMNHWAEFSARGSRPARGRDRGPGVVEQTAADLRDRVPANQWGGDAGVGV